MVLANRLALTACCITVLWGRGRHHGIISACCAASFVGRVTGAPPRRPPPLRLPSDGHFLLRGRFRSASGTMSAAASSPRGDGLADIGAATPGGALHGEDGGGLPSWKERIDVSIARSRKIRGANYVQLATVDHDAMEPRCRTVVFRGFLKGVPLRAVQEVLRGGDGGEGAGLLQGGGDPGGDKYDCVMKMITDARSNKVLELETCHESDKGERGANTAEMVWWFPKSSEQYRIRGRLQFVGGDRPLRPHEDAGEAVEDHRGYFAAERKQQWGNLTDAAREQFYWEDPGLPHAPSDGAGVPPGGRDKDGRVLPAPGTFLLMLLYPTAVDYLRLGDNYRQVDAWEGGAAGAGGWTLTRVNP